MVSKVTIVGSLVGIAGAYYYLTSNPQKVIHHAQEKSDKVIQQAADKTKETVNMVTDKAKEKVDQTNERASANSYST